MATVKRGVGPLSVNRQSQQPAVTISFNTPPGVSLGDAVAEKIGEVWGIGPNGDLNNMYKRTPQEGVWFIAGGIGQCRINSKYLALQIKAMELGLLGPLEH
jgi:hypothetical protein